MLIPWLSSDSRRRLLRRGALAPAVAIVLLTGCSFFGGRPNTVAPAAKLYEDGERGSIILTSSAASQDGQIGQVAYGGAKGGVNGMVLPMARDLMDLGIRVNAILPGTFATPPMLR